MYFLKLSFTAARRDQVNTKHWPKSSRVETEIDSALTLHIFGVIHGVLTVMNSDDNYHTTHLLPNGGGGGFHLNELVLPQKPLPNWSTN